MNPQTLKYLKQDEIGKVIAKGLANLYTNKPQRPVKYLAEWLYNYSHNCKQMKKVLQTQQLRQNSLKAYDQSCKLEAAVKTQKEKQQKTIADTIQDFKNQIANHQYQFEMLEELLPEFIQQQTEITGAYVGELNHPPKPVTEQDSAETAHLNQTTDKLINYIGSSKSHRDLMRGKCLSLTQGVTAKAFTLDDEQPPVQEGQEQPPAPQQKYIYIPNVVKNEAMHYFKIPKLGAYFAVPLIYETYLTEEIFDSALEAKNEYLKNLNEFNEKQKEDIEGLTAEKQELQKKINDLKQKKAQQSQIEAQITELARVEQQLRNREAQKLQEPANELPLKKLKFVVCVDNLGKDQQLSKKDIKFICEIVDHFRECWVNKQKQLLYKDIETHIESIKLLGQDPQTLLQNLNKQTQELSEQQTQELNQIENETTKEYKTEQAKFNKIKQLIKDNKNYLTSFLKLKQFRVVKFRNVIQHLLYFLGFSKADVNQPGKACLNWKLVRQQYITEDNFNNILDYLVQGSKEGEFKFYAKTPFLNQQFQAYDEEAIFKYNIGLGAIVKFIKAALKHRISNVEMRKSQKQKQTEERDQIIAENQKITLQKSKQLQKQKQALTPQQLQNFTEEQWSTKYDEKHPLKAVPAEVVADIDNDM